MKRLPLNKPVNELFISLEMNSSFLNLFSIRFYKQHYRKQRAAENSKPLSKLEATALCKTWAGEPKYYRF